jgi:formylglycine-generating enzyme required for sulfatase activity
MWRQDFDRTNNGAWRGFRARPWAALCLAGLLAACSSSAPDPATGEATYTNSMGMEFARIPAGAIRRNIKEEYDVDVPGRAKRVPRTYQPPVVISQPFYMGKYEVTRAEWNAVMELDDPGAPWWAVLLRYAPGMEESAKKKSLVPIKEEEAHYPVTHVSWDEAQGFIRRLNKKEGTDKYRLPTKAEWEYAARANTPGKFFFGDDDADLEKYAWTNAWTTPRTPPLHAVGQKLPNPWGLYDMYGNAMEWVHDVWSEVWPEFMDAKNIDPAGRPDEYRLVSESYVEGWLFFGWDRGRCIPIYKWHSRTVMDPVHVYWGNYVNNKAIRHVSVNYGGAGSDPDNRHDTVGFRLVISPTIHETGKTNAKRKAAIREQERVFKPCQKESRAKNRFPAVPECHIDNCRRGMP